jgi:hypothetical protein
VVGPAGLSSSKEVKDLKGSGTFVDTDVFQYSSHGNVSTTTEELAFEPLHHSVYEGRERLGHYVRISPKQYAAYDARSRLLGKFGSTKAAFGAVGRQRRKSAQ